MSDPRRPKDPDPGLETDEIGQIRVPQSPAKPSKSTEPEGYELEGGPLPDDEDLPAPVPIPIPPRPPADRPRSRARPKSKLEFETPEPEDSDEFDSEVSEVDPVWTRWSEWGSDLIRLGSVGLGTLFLAWLFSGSLSLVLLTLLVGGAAMVALSYPILVTLERPVRITPEQAVNDFYAAASHHFPHYRRMWLLLSVQGRESGHFDSFEAFRSHWKGKIARWKQQKGVGNLTPLKFEVESFRADKSTDKETARADYMVQVYLRDRESEGPIESFRMVHGLVRGPDRMWYLNRGVLEAR